MSLSKCTKCGGPWSKVHEKLCLCSKPEKVEPKASVETLTVNVKSIDGIRVGDVEIVAPDGLPGLEAKIIIDGKDMGPCRSFCLKWAVYDVATITIERYVCKKVG